MQRETTLSSLNKPCDLTLPIGMALVGPPRLSPSDGPSACCDARRCFPDDPGHLETALTAYVTGIASEGATSDEHRGEGHLTCGQFGSAEALRLAIDILGEMLLAKM